MSSETRVCQNCSQEYTLDQQDLVLLAERELPVPKECHVCIWKHLQNFWTFGHFRKTRSALSGKSIITTFAESVPFPLYSREEWSSDAWDPLDFGKPYDPNRSFVEQFKELFVTAPRPHQSGTKNVNCQWSDDVWNCKNCYLSRSMVNCEDSFYLYRVLDTKDSVDATFFFGSEFLYDCLYCFKSSKLQYCIDTRESVDSAFLYDCRNCQDCFMSWNLRNKRYCIENVQYTKEEYEKRRAEFDTEHFDSVQELKKQFWDHIRNDVVHRGTHNIKVENSKGNFLEECKDCKECYYIQFSENSRYVLRGVYLKDAMYSVAAITEKSYMTVMDDTTYDVIVSSHSTNCRYSAYLDYCEDCEYCFGCAGLRKKKFCILNTQYTEEEYKKLIGVIKEDMKKREEWGTFFPKELAYSGYNLSSAMLYFPQTTEKILEDGYRLEEDAVIAHEGIDPGTLQGSIREIDNEFTKQAIICPKTKRRFNVAEGELLFYQRFNIPIPHYHPDYRTVQRLKPLTVTMKYKHNCMYCKKEIDSFYPPEWEYKNVACDECYKQNIN